MWEGTFCNDDEMYMGTMAREFDVPKITQIESDSCVQLNENTLTDGLKFREMKT